jgi:AcrR family transcriptional regulator
MPKIVDWDARRDEILSATWRVIVRDGIAGATVRAIAREAGCSPGILGARTGAPPGRGPDGR